jgi:bacterioferritin
MKGNATIIKHLNTILGNELVAINQYFLHSRMLKDWGFNKLAQKEYEESIEEMKHADTLTQRILFLEGLPNLQDLGKINIGETIPEMLQSDLNVEHKALADLRAAITDCEALKDFASRDILMHILENEEEHVDFLETQLGLIKAVGLENYQQSQM